jgi:hypothetical protein
MKLFFLGATFAIIYQMRYARTIKGSYDRDRDTFRHEILIGISLVLAFVVHEGIKGRGMIHYLVQVRACMSHLWGSLTYATKLTYTHMEWHIVAFTHAYSRIHRRNHWLSELLLRDEIQQEVDWFPEVCSPGNCCATSCLECDRLQSEICLTWSSEEQRAMF